MQKVIDIRSGARTTTHTRDNVDDVITTRFTTTVRAHPLALTGADQDQNTEQPHR